MITTIDNRLVQSLAARDIFKISDELEEKLSLGKKLAIELKASKLDKAAEKARLASRFEKKEETKTLFLGLEKSFKVLSSLLRADKIENKKEKQNKILEVIKVLAKALKEELKKSSKLKRDLELFAAEGARIAAQEAVRRRGFEDGFQNLSLAEMTVLLSGPAIGSKKAVKRQETKFKAARAYSGDDSDLRATRKKNKIR